jgi:hypothetical protein
MLQIENVAVDHVEFSEQVTRVASCACLKTGKAMSLSLDSTLRNLQLAVCF